MATARPFAYNIGAPIAGTEQVGGLAVGTPTSGFASTGLPWWNGPDEDLGYVIAASVPGNTQTTPVFSSSPLTLSPTYIGNSMNLSNGNQTVEQKFGYVQSVLGQTLINDNDKVMFSVLCSLAAPATFPNGHFVGIGTTSMNYNGTTPDLYQSYPGTDNQSIGLNSGGEYWYNGTIQASGLPTWTTGDTIDVAVSVINNKIWIRVNGGNWNNNPADNPATGTGGQTILGGLTSFYPVLCPAYEGTMTILNNAAYGVPSGFTLLGTNVNASVGFFRSAALTDPSFISIANAVAGPSGGGPFASGSAAKTWLNSNGYWTSYAGGTGAGWLFYYAEGSIGSTPPPVNNGDVIFYNQSNATITYNPNYPGGGANFNLYFNVNQADGTSYLTQFNALVASGGTVAMSQGSNTAIYSGPNTAYNITNFGSGNVLVISGLGATLIQAASTPFVSGTPITVVVS